MDELEKLSLCQLYKFRFKVQELLELAMKNSNKIFELGHKSSQILFVLRISEHPVCLCLSKSFYVSVYLLIMSTLNLGLEQSKRANIFRHNIKKFYN